MERTNLYQSQPIKVEDDTSSSTKYTEENTWTLIESLKYSQSENANTEKTFNITLLICIICVIGIILSIGIFKWYTKKKVIFTKI